jgi:hypothetical protein
MAASRWRVWVLCLVPGVEPLDVRRGRFNSLCFIWDSRSNCWGFQAREVSTLDAHGRVEVGEQKSK